MSLHEQVRRFHELGGIPVLHGPQVPDAERVRLRAALVLEECLELLAACYGLDEDGSEARFIAKAIEMTTAVPKVNLVKVADALADIDYVVEGTRLEFGIFGAPIADEVHAANMRKFPLCNVCQGGGRMPALTTASKHGPMTDAPCAHCQGRGRRKVAREDGKILKPEGWVGPDVAAALRAQGYKL